MSGDVAPDRYARERFREYRQALARYPQSAAEHPGLAATESFDPPDPPIPPAIECGGAPPSASIDYMVSGPRWPSREPIVPGTVLAPGSFQAHRYRVFGVKSGGMGRVYLADSLDAPPRRLHDKAAIKTVVDFDEWQELRRAKGAPADESQSGDLRLP